MLYSVTLKNFEGRPIQIYNNVIADGIIENREVRYLILEDQVRIEVPMTSYIVEFSKERADLAKAQENNKPQA